MFNTILLKSGEMREISKKEEKWETETVSKQVRSGRYLTLAQLNVEPKKTSVRPFHSLSCVGGGAVDSM